MPTPADTLALVVGGQVRDDWDTYEIDSDLLTPADAWRVSFGLKEGNLPAALKVGTPVEIRVGNDRVMMSRIDAIDDDARKDALHVVIGGRDGAAVLLDCSAPVFVAKSVSLEEIIAKVVVPLGIRADQIRIAAEDTHLREKINVNPGESAWEVLANAAEANGLWPWFEPDGTLVVGGPDYEAPPVAALVMRLDGRGNNLINLRRRQTIQGRWSELTVLGQAHGTATEPGKHAVKHTQPDKGVSWYRPKIVIDHEADSVAVAKDRARKLLADGRLRGFGLFAEVAGHRIVAPGEPGHGKLWTPGQRVRVISERHEIDDIFFLMARRFTGGRRQDARTHLVFKEDGAWVIDAHPHKRKHRCKKNSANLQMPDLTTDRP